MSYDVTIEQPIYEVIVEQKEVTVDLVNANIINVIQSAVFEWVDPPLTRNSTGTIGQMSFDDDYFYICVATNVWARQFLLKGW